MTVTCKVTEDSTHLHVISDKFIEFGRLQRHQCLVFPYLDGYELMKTNDVYMHLNLRDGRSKGPIQVTYVHTHNFV